MQQEPWHSGKGIKLKHSGKGTKLNCGKVGTYASYKTTRIWENINNQEQKWYSFQMNYKLWVWQMEVSQKFKVIYVIDLIVKKCRVGKETYKIN